MNDFFRKIFYEKLDLFKRVFFDTFSSLSQTAEYPFILRDFKDDKNVYPDNISLERLDFLVCLAKDIRKFIQKSNSRELPFIVLDNFLKSFIREFEDFNILERNITFLLNSLKFSLYFAFNKKIHLFNYLEEINYNLENLLKSIITVDYSYKSFILNEIESLELMVKKFIKNKDVKTEEKRILKSIIYKLDWLKINIKNNRLKAYSWDKEKKDEYYERLIKESLFINKKPKEIVKMIKEIFYENIDLYEKLLEKSENNRKEDNKEKIYKFKKIKFLIRITLLEIYNKFKKDFPLKFKFNLNSIKILETPSFFSNFWPLAAYFRNSLYVNLENLKSFGEIEKMLKLILIHEIYPGHLYQELFVKESKNFITKHITIPTFYEGWSLYLENLALDRLDLNEQERLNFIKFKLLRCIRSIYDLKVNVSYLEDNKDLNRMLTQAQKIKIINNSYLDYLKEKVQVNPGYYLSYVFGYIQFLDLHKKFKVGYNIIKNGEIPFWFLKNN